MSGLCRKCVAECIGTYLLVLFGCGAVHSAVLTGSQSGLWQVAIVWGVVISLVIYVIGPVSGAHINPAITVAFATRRRFAWNMVPPYILAQLVGAFAAAATLFVLFQPWLAAKEAEKRVIRGEPGSIVTAMCYGEYFPNPGPLAGTSDPWSPELVERRVGLVSEPVAFFAEMLGTMILAVVVFAVTDVRNRDTPAHLAPLVIGLTVAALISFIAPLTQGCFNPARDFGPRLFAYLAGWGKVALPGPSPTGFFTVYVLAPIVGAVVGAHLYEFILRPGNPDVSVQPDDPRTQRVPCV